ncbi:hypothetical protein OFQ54_00980 [Brachyspira hyodysenteriae]|uniref:hypothetical protein n=1 Tax=Brachyspira hyodysenteriae TaxID=159 RepID=UPI0022CDB617|nr:hypothetical protein [Brachyspira hyodysenteriae]MCZ9960412.1 hypothetical protein [Brachyspira hyodysenteriae]
MKKKEKDILYRLLKNYIEEYDKSLSILELTKKYEYELKELCKYDNDTKDIFGYVNSYWVLENYQKN